SALITKTLLSLFLTNAKNGYRIGAWRQWMAR
ncbi:unnamed protein product, partial [marine sediment metagenome]